MKPFVLKQHDKDRVALRGLLASELGRVSGGVATCPSPDDIPKMETTTTTPGGTSNDGCDEN